MKHIIFVLFAMISISAIAQNNFKVPKYEKFKLKNGLTVFLMEQHEVPLINVSAVFDAGSIHDSERYGLASLTADALTFGTKKYTKAQIEEMTDFVGADLRTYISKDNSGVTSSFAVKDQDKIFDIIQQVLMFPVFDITEFDKHKQRTLLELEQQKESPRTVIGNYFNEFVFKNFPYATPGDGIKSTVDKISAGDVKSFYTSNYTTGKGAIAVVGDFKTADMKKRLQVFSENGKQQNPE
nr:insulinase family protein [Dyadobacter sp. NIV53]